MTGEAGEHEDQPAGSKAAARRPRHADDDQYQNGPPTNLKPLHWDIIKRHLAGYRSRVIAQELDIHEQTVWRTLKHQEAQRLKREFIEATEEDLHALFAKTVGAVDEALNAADHKTRLQAVDRWVSLVKQLSPEAPSTQINVNGDVTINAREKIARELSKMVEDDGDVIDVEADDSEKEND
jgi:ribosomal protein S13